MPVCVCVRVFVFCVLVSQWFTVENYRSELTYVCSSKWGLCEDVWLTRLQDAKTAPHVDGWTTDPRVHYTKSVRCNVLFLPQFAWTCGCKNKWFSSVSEISWYLICHWFLEWCRRNRAERSHVQFCLGSGLHALAGPWDTTRGCRQAADTCSKHGAQSRLTYRVTGTVSFSSSWNFQADFTRSAVSMQHTIE